jgi:hypothetical protein
MIAKWSCQIIGKRETRKKISNFAVNKQPLLKARFLFLLFACTFPALIKAEETSEVKSPDKAYVISWVDRSVSGDPANEKRIITLKTVQDGRVLFSFTTQPRDTRAFWSSDSKKCFFLDGPDDGDVNTWLFLVGDIRTKPNVIQIFPLKPLIRHYEQLGGDLWRGNITDVLWYDNQTLDMLAWDKDGQFKIRLKTNDLDHPIMKKIGPSPY